MKQAEQKSKRWWHYGHMWLVVGGPAVVVAASMVTIYLAISSPNELVSDRELDTSAAAKGQKTMDSSMAPAQTARNHAQTGVVPVKP